ncbi:unnamed protein product [Cuscuta europaea]|uniref:Uncharacterized protein n=1 Tax=Cuscuta europaea TaxID=41803 RepID=A0A9P0Z8Y3_CUSEU|nr:unnamed protein product [Cuscuta europaea]
MRPRIPSAWPLITWSSGCKLRGPRGRARAWLRPGRLLTEAARVATEEARVAKEEAASKAREDAIAAFTAEGWKAEEQKEWLSSVVQASVDAWVGGPDKMCLAEKGDSYYQGGEFFTQRLIYRKLARHFKLSPEEFQPEVYGLPPRQPDIRVSLPEGEERPVLEDSETLRECGLGGDGDEAEGEATSKAVDGGDVPAANL